jgi:NADPH:quinone reductase-like Zn-dependent oxidoreductase
MKEIRLRQPGRLHNLYIGDGLPSPPGHGEIRVRLHASSLNYHDYLVVSGKLPVENDRIPMSDGAGEIVEVGPGVTEFIIGDRVISTFFPDWLAGRPDGLTARVPGDSIDGYARHEVVAPAAFFTRAPAGYSYTEAATLVCAGLTAWRSLFVEGRLKPGETVLVQGSGGVSVFALQLAKAAGARVIATSSSSEKLERLRALGADHLINYVEEPEWGLAAYKLADGRGVDHVVEVGGSGTLGQSIEACRMGGHISLIGVLAGFAGNISTAAIMMRQLRILGITVGNRAQQQDLVRAVEANSIHPVIDRNFPLEAIAEAFRYQETGRHFGKICLEW